MSSKKFTLLVLLFWIAVPGSSQCLVSSEAVIKTKLGLMELEGGIGSLAGPNELVLQKLNFAFPDLREDQKQNARLILTEASALSITDMAQLAYILASAVGESYLRPVTEMRASVGSKQRMIQDMYWYTGYYGRGFVPLIWKENYQKFADRLRVELISNPDLALNPTYAAKIITLGMRDGLFTGKKLSDYVLGSKQDFASARQVVSDSDGSLIASHAQKILNAAVSEDDGSFGLLKGEQLEVERIIRSCFGNPARKMFSQYPTKIGEWRNVSTFSETDNPEFFINKIQSFSARDFNLAKIRLHDTSQLDLHPIIKPTEYLNDIKNSKWHGPYIDTSNEFKEYYRIFSINGSGTNTYYIMLGFGMDNRGYNTLELQFRLNGYFVRSTYWF